MSHRPLDPTIADRLRIYAERPGSPSARAAITAWLSRAESGSTDVGSTESLVDLVRALNRLAYSRSLYGFEETATGSDLDVRLQQREIAEAFALEADLVEHYTLDTRGRDAVVDARTDMSEEALGLLAKAFHEAFK